MNLLKEYYHIKRTDRLSENRLDKAVFLLKKTILIKFAIQLKAFNLILFVYDFTCFYKSSMENRYGFFRIKKAK